jgi:hypothetical protein
MRKKSEKPQIDRFRETAPIKIESLEALREMAQRFMATHQENDVATQREILRELIEDEQDCYQRKLRLLAELKTFMQAARTADGTQERVGRLIEAFRFSCNLRAIGYEELADQDTGNKAQEATFSLYDQLKAIIPDGATALVKLLEDPSPNVRSSIAVLLLREMPERAIPVIEEIERTSPASDASISAGFALSRYRSKMERQS